MDIVVNFVDIYGGETSVLFRTKESIRSMISTIDDFLYLIGDSLIDESSYSAARRFKTFVKKIGWMVRKLSRASNKEDVTVILPSGEIIPSMKALRDKEVAEEISLPIGSSRDIILKMEDSDDE